MWNGDLLVMEYLCWKQNQITVFENYKKVAFNIATEASYVYIWSGQKLIKNAKNGPIWMPKACIQTVLPDSVTRQFTLIGQN